MTLTLVSERPKPKTTRDWLHGAPPPAAKQYVDGSHVATAAVESYDAYVAAHSGNAPENVAALRAWYATQRNANAQSQPA